MHHYLLVVSPGPFIAVRVPYPMPPWRHILRALTPLMRAHGLRQKDISSVEGLIPMDPDDREAEDIHLARRFDEKLAMPRFHLYDWHGGSFRSYREPLE